MARAYGSSAHLLMKRETVYGQAATGNYLRMPFNRCNLGSEQGLIDDPVLGQGRDPLAPLQDVINDEGDIVVPVDPRYLGLWLTGLFGDPDTTDNLDGSWDHEFASGGEDLPSYTVEVGMPKVPAFFLHAGVKLNSIALEFIHDSTGFINVYKDGAQILAVSGVDTRQQTADTITFFRLYDTDGTGAQPNVFSWDDVYVTDQGIRLGESRVKTLYPNGVTADADWTPSGGGDNDEAVDETLVNGDTDYVASATPGDLDIYALGDLGFTPGTIHGLQLTMCARKDDAETREVRLKLKSGAVTEHGTTQAMAATYQYFSDVYEEDPDAEGPWTASAVNAMQIGIEVVT
jgi:hypothetical protein